MSFDDRPDFAIRLEAARAARGFSTAKDAATFFGWPYDTYIQHERGERGISRAAGKYADAFRVSAAWLLTGEGRGVDAQPTRVPIVGLAGAGPHGSVLFADGDGNFGDIPPPTNWTPETKALEVRGDSMYGMINNGWLVTYDEVRAPSYELDGQPCVVWLDDGRVLVKIVELGRSAGLFDLISTNAPALRDVKLTAAAYVTNIIPERAARKFIRRNPDKPIVDVTLDGEVSS
ncbi:hypothetical protein GCM10008171_32570 [Methylopila jiangsuensis]|uniref:Peptidase S24/S26A/S26B/S26C domain-containing protein n=1 Tax=Methylopila jiangsuensis TaxID=586230 RepID=A0A9W6JKR7_9HYPH|nr:S24 family peptidase [Methylopila jiangsuensis]MDR6284606.1 hypothetical protein [Methylopila jiangsuensis]GLK78003.1 hypothetical protein GCM10008171_32570 [Methylopila jiangsuensis]